MPSRSSQSSRGSRHASPCGNHSKTCLVNWSMAWPKRANLHSVQAGPLGGAFSIDWVFHGSWLGWSLWARCPALAEALWNFKCPLPCRSGCDGGKPVPCNLAHSSREEWVESGEKESQFHFWIVFWYRSWYRLPLDIDISPASRGEVFFFFFFFFLIIELLRALREPLGTTSGNLRTPLKQTFLWVHLSLTSLFIPEEVESLLS